MVPRGTFFKYSPDMSIEALLFSCVITAIIAGIGLLLYKRHISMELLITFVMAFSVLSAAYSALNDRHLAEQGPPDDYEYR